jgi:hypothetical protein
MDGSIYASGGSQKYFCNFEMLPTYHERSKVNRLWDSILYFDDRGVVNKVSIPEGSSKSTRQVDSG